MKLMQRFGDHVPEHESTQERHRRWSKENIAYLESVGAPLNTNNHGTSYLFREAGKPKADFYPGTGRWRIAGSNNTFRGGAEAFWKWYQKQGKK